MHVAYRLRNTKICTIIIWKEKQTKKLLIKAWSHTSITLIFGQSIWYMYPMYLSQNRLFWLSYVHISCHNNRRHNQPILRCILRLTKKGISWLRAQRSGVKAKWNRKQSFVASALKRRLNNERRNHSPSPNYDSTLLSFRPNSPKSSWKWFLSSSKSTTRKGKGTEIWNAV